LVGIAGVGAGYDEVQDVEAEVLMVVGTAGTTGTAGYSVVFCSSAGGEGSAEEAVGTVGCSVALVRPDEVQDVELLFCSSAGGVGSMDEAVLMVVGTAGTAGYSLVFCSSAGGVGSRDEAVLMVVGTVGCSMVLVFWSAEGVDEVQEVDEVFCSAGGVATGYWGCSVVFAPTGGEGG
jgi:hypothetical protein